MRCLTLAEALHATGFKCTFVFRNHPGNLLKLISERGFDVRMLEVQPSWDLRGMGDENRLTAHADWLGTDWITDAKQTGECMGVGQVDWLVVDHYALDACWEQALRPFCQRLMVTDDLAD